MRIRRNSPEPRLEMTPLMDVIFLLLTFFVFSLTLLVRAQILGVSLPSLAAAEDAKAGTTITLALGEDGRCAVNGEVVESDRLIDRIRELRTQTPEAKLLIAADTGGKSGDLLALVDRLSAAGLRDFALVGRPPRGTGASESAPPASGRGAGEDSGSDRR